MSNKPSPIVKERRRKLAKLMFQGFSLNKACEQLTEKEDFSVAHDTIKQDWYRRDNWLEEAFDIETENSRSVIMEIIAEEKTIKGAGWSLFHETKNPNTRLGALKMISSINKDILDLLTSAGIIELNSDSDALKETLAKMDEAIGAIDK